MDEGAQDEIQRDDTTPVPDAVADPITQDPDPVKGIAGQGETDDSDLTEDHTASPLEPGGKRFKQVYARAKDAEQKLQVEREARARLEGELAARRESPATPATPSAPRLTWAQLEAGIDEGKITRAQAMDYRDETIRTELETKFETRLAKERTGREQSTTVQSELAQYTEAIPEIATLGTPERQRVEAEFAYLLRMGYDAKDPRTEVLACRASFGDPKIAKERRHAKTIPTGRDTMQDISSSGKPKSDAADPLKTITATERKHYQKMIDRGVYKGWSEVKEELLFVPPR